jgi:hypothetical protein
MLDGTNICATADSRKVKPRAVHMPLKLSDAELDAVLQAARPLPIDMRDPFLQAVAMRSPAATSSVPVSCIRSSENCSGNFLTRRTSVTLAAGRNIVRRHAHLAADPAWRRPGTRARRSDRRTSREGAGRLIPPGSPFLIGAALTTEFRRLTIATD